MQIKKDLKEAFSPEIKAAKEELKIVKEAVDAHVHGDLICNEPFIHDESLDGIDPVDYEDVEEYKDARNEMSRRPWMRTLWFALEAIVVWCILMVPSWLLSWRFPHERYNLIHFKVGDPGFTHNVFQEFYRASIFVATSYVAYIFAAWAVGMSSAAILGFARIFKIPLSMEVRQSLKLVKRTQEYVAMLVWFLLELFLGSLILYTPALFKKDSDIQMNVFLNRQSTERFLLGAAFVTALFALEKYVIQVVTYQFHRESLSTRVGKNNEVRTYIGVLYRRGQHIREDERHFSLKSDFAQAGIHELNYDKLPKTVAPKIIAERIFKVCVPGDRDYLKPEDFRQYLDTDDASKTAFRLFDTELRGKIDLDYLIATFQTIYSERDKIQEALLENSLVIRRFDNALMTIVAILSIVGGLSLIHEKGYTLVLSLFSIFLTLAFLVKDTVTRLSDAFRLIYIERAFDVGDVIKVDGIAFTVTQVRLFTSTFLRNSDKTVVYIPNHILAGKIIVNQKRLSLTVDRASISVFGNIPMAKIGDFKSQLKGFNEDHYPEYSGSCSLVIKELAGNRVEISLDLSFQPCTDEKVLIRRNAFKQKVIEILESLQISAAEPKF